MPAQLTATANDILNRVAAEVGLEQVSDPWTDEDKSFIQMKALLNIAGEELSQNYPWEFLIKEHSFVTDGVDNEYTLPSDFLYIVNQTGWDRTNDVPLVGPLSPQEYQYLVSSESSGSNIYISFRFNEGVFKVLPDDSSGKTIAFEYVSRNWVLDSTTGNTYRDSVADGADTPQFDRTLLSRYLKVKFLEAKGFDSTKAQADLNHTFMLMTARERGSPILNAGRCSGSFAYLNSTSIPTSGYGA